MMMMISSRRFAVDDRGKDGSRVVENVPILPDRPRRRFTDDVVSANVGDDDGSSPPPPPLGRRLGAATTTDAVVPIFRARRRRRRSPHRRRRDVSQADAIRVDLARMDGPPPRARAENAAIPPSAVHRVRATRGS